MLVDLPKVPFNYSVINDYLIMGTKPKASDYVRLKKLDVGLIINMRAENKVLRPKSLPIPFIWVPTLDTRFTPIKPKQLLKAIEYSQETIKAGHKVYVYCRAGRHRSLVMSAAILISMGQTPDEAMALIKKQRLAADPDAKHIRAAVMRFNEFWSEHK